MEQQICRTAAARFGRAGWGGDNVPSRVCHKIFGIHTRTLCTFLMLLFEKVGGIASNWLLKNAMKHLWAKRSL